MLHHRGNVNVDAMGIAVMARETAPTKEQAPVVLANLPPFTNRSTTLIIFFGSNDKSKTTDSRQTHQPANNVPVAVTKTKQRTQQ
jgi:hypothetical protein